MTSTPTNTPRRVQQAQTSPAPVILAPTPPEHVNDDPAWGPLDGPRTHRAKIVAATRWWTSAAEPEVLAVGQYMLITYDKSVFNDHTHGRLLAEALGAAGGRDLFDVGRFWHRALVEVGVDPMVLCALRGTDLPQTDLLLIASAGLTPTEAHDLHRSGALDMDTVRVMIALRRRR